MKPAAIVTNCLLASVVVVLVLIYQKLPGVWPITEGEYQKAMKTSRAAIDDAEARSLHVRVMDSVSVLGKVDIGNDINVREARPLRVEVYNDGPLRVKSVE